MQPLLTRTIDINAASSTLCTLLVHSQRVTFHTSISQLFHGLYSRGTRSPVPFGLNSTLSPVAKRGYRRPLGQSSTILARAHTASFNIPPFAKAASSVSSRSPGSRAISTLIPTFSVTRQHTLEGSHTVSKPTFTSAASTTQHGAIISDSNQSSSRSNNCGSLAFSSQSSPAVAGIKRRASSELSPNSNQHSHSRTSSSEEYCHPASSISYGTSIFFQRPFVTLATPTTAGQYETTRNYSSKKMSFSEGRRREMVIRLTKREAEICKVLDIVAQKYEQDTGNKVQLRIAGGWVRDKLLGLSCHDLDIGVDTMMGYDFAMLVNDYLESQGQKKRTIAKIATNPEKSKHLETATMAIMGVPLDFVNLRSEVYDDSSRIPSEIQFGTPSEDAYRRDTTINALFYNIHTHKVEDFTGRGLDDLRSGLIRTPLEAYETFWQDPLRVLRCIRFASRFHFQLVEDAKKAMLDPRIKEALRTKISKERIGAELEKMIDDGAGRSVGIGLLQELDLYDVVFSAPEVNIQEQPKGTSAVEGPVRDIGEAFKLVWVMEWLLRLNPTDSDEFSRDGVVYTAKRDEGQEALLRATKGQAFTDELFTVVRSEPPQDIPIIASREDQQQQQQKQPKDKQDEEQQQAPPPQQSAPNPEKQAKRSLIFASMLFPYRDMVTSVNKRPVPAAAWILRYGLKARNQDIDAVSKMMDSIKLVQTTVNNVHFGTLASATSLCSETASQDKSPQERVIADERAEIGMAIRDVGSMAVIGAKWPCMFLLGLGIELVSYFEQLHQGTIDYEAKAIIEKYNTFLKKAQMYEVDYAFAWKYIVDGKELTKMLDTRPGPKTNAYLQLVMQWQLRNPRASKEDCQKWIEANKERILTAC